MLSLGGKTAERKYPMGDIVKIQHRGIVGDLAVGSSVVVELIDENHLHLRVATLGDPVVERRVATPQQQADDVAEMQEAGISDQRKGGSDV